MHVCNCPGENHPTFGACMRGKNLSFPGVFTTRSAGAGRGDRDRQKVWDKEIDAYKAARKEGISPAGTRMPQIEAARKLSDKVGKAYQAETGGFAD